MHTTTKKKNDDMTIIVNVDVSKFVTGHRVLPRGRVFKDRRRLARSTERVKNRKEIN